MSISINEHLLSAQDDYYNGQFRAAVEKLKYILSNEQLDCKEELRVKQNLIISIYASETQLPTMKCYSSKNHQNFDASGPLLSDLNSYIVKALRCSFKNRDEISTAGETSIIEGSFLDATQEPLDQLFSELISDSFIALFNIASLQYERHQYESSQMILERLLAFSSIEPLDNGASIKVCFLLIEVLLRQWNDHMACYNEQHLNLFRSQAFETLYSAELSLANLLDDVAALPTTKSDSPDSGGVDESIIDLAVLMELILTYRVSLYTCRIHIATGSYDRADKSITFAMNFFSESIQPLISSDVAITLTDEHQMHIYCNALSSYLGFNSWELPFDVQILKRSLQSQLEMGRHLQSEVSYRQDNTEKSLQNLNSIINERNGSNSHKEKKNQLYNNSSLVYLKQKKFHLACMYSQKAVDVIKRTVLSDVKEEIVVEDMAQRDIIEENNDDLKNCDYEKQKESDQEINEELDQSVHYCGALPQRCTAELLYNTAVTFLLSGNPLGALLYFEQIVSDFGNSPLLWIRMGECCIRCHADQLKNRETGQILCASGYTGRGSRLQFQCDDSLSSDGIDADNGSTSQSNCSLNKAVQYLSKAVFLIRKIRDKSNPDSIVNNSDQNTSLGEEGSPISSSDSSSSSRIPCRVDSIESAALLRLTYVHLELNSPLSAFTAANAILASPHLSSTGSETRFLAETYACEALCALGKVEEAMIILHPQYTVSQSAPPTSSLLNSKNIPEYLFTDNSAPHEDKNTVIHKISEQYSETVISTDIVREVPCYEKLVSTSNYATTLIMQGNFSKSMSILENLREQCPTFAPCVKLLSYLLLRNGQQKEALSVLKGNRLTSKP